MCSFELFNKIQTTLINRQRPRNNGQVNDCGDHKYQEVVSLGKQHTRTSRSEWLEQVKIPSYWWQAVSRGEKQNFQSNLVATRNNSTSNSSNNIVPPLATSQPTQHSTATFVCDSHRYLNSSITPLPFTDHSGQTVHRNNLLPQFSQQSNISFPEILLPMIRTISCSVHYQTKCLFPILTLVRSLVHAELQDSGKSTFTLIISSSQLSLILLDHHHNHSHQNVSLLSSPMFGPQLTTTAVNGTFNKNINNNVNNWPNSLFLCQSTNSAQVFLLILQNWWLSLYLTQNCQASQNETSCLLLLLSSLSVHFIHSDSFPTQPFANGQVCNVDKSMSIISEQKRYYNNRTQEKQNDGEKENESEEQDLNSICKYLPTSDRFSCLSQKCNTTNISSSSISFEENSLLVHHQQKQQQHQQSDSVWPSDVSPTTTKSTIAAATTTKLKFRISLPTFNAFQLPLSPLLTSSSSSSSLNWMMIVNSCWFIRFLLIVLLFFQWHSPVQ